ncbi:hypothetical protein R1flu_012575 [Riccia fluitans]|uniref:Uncharacterized protein n=1 Tax=Riccia fluitans TaxID=41844 RepID=A0ABD1ZC54_9MARC
MDVIQPRNETDVIPGTARRCSRRREVPKLYIQYNFEGVGEKHVGVVTPRFQVKRPLCGWSDSGPTPRLMSSNSFCSIGKPEILFDSNVTVAVLLQAFIVEVRFTKSDCLDGRARPAHCPRRIVGLCGDLAPRDGIDINGCVNSHSTGPLIVNAGCKPGKYR